MLNEPCQGSWAAGGAVGFSLSPARRAYKNLAGRSIGPQPRRINSGQPARNPADAPSARGLTGAAAGQVN
jgi:hypothetical protein